MLVNGDTLDENDENFFLNLSNASNASIVDAQGLGTITDDDSLPSVAIGDVTVTEGDTGTVTASFNVTLAPASGREVSVYVRDGRWHRDGASGLLSDQRRAHVRRR